MELDDAIKSRRSIKKYSRKKPDWRDILTAIDLTRYAPMAGDLFTLKYVLTKDEDKIVKLAEASQQEFVSNAKYVLVVCSNPSLPKNAYEERGERYVRQQAGSAIQTILLKLEDLGLSTTWVGHFVDSQVKSILDIPKKIQVEAILPIGYKSKTSKPDNKNIVDIDSILFFEKYGNKKMKRKKLLE